MIVYTMHPKTKKEYEKIYDLDMLGFDVRLIVDEDIPKNEVHLVDYGKILGKIINIGDRDEKNNT